jgi:hypothetical protein
MECEVSISDIKYEVLNLKKNFNKEFFIFFKIWIKAYDKDLDLKILGVMHMKGK